MTSSRASAVAANFELCPPRPKQRLPALLELISRTAATTPGVGEVEEALEWYEPACLTNNGAVGAVRIDSMARDPQRCASCCNGRTSLVNLFPPP